MINDILIKARIMKVIGGPRAGSTFSESLYHYMSTGSSV